MGSEITSLLDGAVKGQSLTYQGVTVGLIILLVSLLVWFAKIQFRKEERLTDRLVEMSEESVKILKEKTEQAAKVIQENTLAMQALKMSLDVMTQDVRRIDHHQQEAARLAQERDKRRGSS